MLDFFIQNLPTKNDLFIGGPLGLLWAFACLYFAGYAKVKKGLKTGYSRKIFHFLIFITVSVLHVTSGSPMVCLFGGMVSIVVFYAILRGNGNILYEAMAREKDAPRRTYFIIAPYCATLIGGLASNILFGEFAVIGYLVTGLGDAIGEPIGTRFGRHHYRVPTLTRIISRRSVEGSVAVFLACLLALVIGIVFGLKLDLTTQFLIRIVLIALAGTVLEAASPHGWDNATLQIIPSLMAKYLLQN